MCPGLVRRITQEKGIIFARIVGRTLLVGSTLLVGRTIFKTKFCQEKEKGKTVAGAGKFNLQMGPSDHPPPRVSLPAR